MPGKNIELTLNDWESMRPVTHALSTELRLRILLLIADTGMSVNEIARALDVPVSTAALNVRELEEAGLIRTEEQPGRRGTLKLCFRRIDEVRLRFIPRGGDRGVTQEYELPVGAYAGASGIRPTCGLAGHDEEFGMYDDPEAFFQPFRLRADLVWMADGCLEYRFPRVLHPEKLTSLEFSFEACSEAPGYRDDWLSDIYVAVNGVELGVWRCPGDFGSHRGRYNPAWWPDASTQYGMLVHWRVDSYGTALEKQRISKVSLKSLALEKGESLRLEIGSRRVDGRFGGLNLFGRGFGDHPQGICMRCVYQDDVRTCADAASNDKITTEKL